MRSGSCCLESIPGYLLIADYVHYLNDKMHLRSVVSISLSLQAVKYTDVLMLYLLQKLDIKYLAAARNIPQLRDCDGDPGSFEDAG
ncbi:hypothetical protein A0H81_08489 [Grifola frondosa]|uniref:Uncharacterized protein n=1 Tax=Grifola frondosa TaxID=5627 RepID=A0A1C7M2K7_GRIFR|nr:hypothetical protein A0H81_08489 [Grifola frondosa]